MSDEWVFSPECGQMLGLACFACMQNLADGDAALVREDDTVARAKMARIGPTLVLVEHMGDQVRGKLHGFGIYRVEETEPGEPFFLDPRRLLFVLSEKHFEQPKEWHLQL